jgi:hypothetical protein
LGVKAKSFFMRQCLLFLLLSVLILSGCASKHYAKVAKKYDQAGLYRDAATMYYQSVAANNKNIEAKLGLQRNGQLLLQEKLDLFKTHYDNNAVKDAVYSYIDAQNYYEQVKGVGVQLIFPSETKVYYDEVKEKYLSQRYIEAMQALDVESFASAEAILSEILSIDKTYKDSQTQWVTAKYEPIYRQGNEQYANGLYRTAYYSFNTIITGVGTYKDAVDRKAEALDKAMITIAVAPFASNYSYQTISAQTLRTKAISEIGQVKSPFYKIVADDVINSLPQDGKKSSMSKIQPFISTYSQSIAAKAVLVGHLVTLQEVQGDLQVKERKGYLRRSEEYTDKTTGEKKTRTVYDKTTYSEYSRKNSSLIVFEYSLIDVKTGAILVSDAITLSNDASTNYASFQGDAKKLVPGTWKSKSEASTADEVWDSTDAVSKLQTLLDAPREIKSAQVITSELIAQAAKNTAAAIEKYNPEK